jgi:hypothetical protein
VLFRANSDQLVDGVRLDILPMAEAAWGFHPAHAAVWGWSSNSSRFPAGSCFVDKTRPGGWDVPLQASTASPAAKMFFAALMSACSAGREQWVHRNTAWLSRDFGSTCPHAEQRCDVCCGGTVTMWVPV